MRPSSHRPTRIIVDLGAIQHNLRQVQSTLPDKTSIFAVVKADAYGHGAVPVARALAHLVSGFCVSNIDEAVELREAGLHHPILILGVVPWQSIELAVHHQLTLTVASQEWLEQAIEGGQSLSGLRVHIKVDSGMGRLGFRDSESANRVMKELEKLGASCEGIFTHFATADQADEEQFWEQYHRFCTFLGELDTIPPMVHASNSATAIWHSQTVFSMVRLGNILYGLNPSGRVLVLPYGVRPALSLVSELVHVKCIPSGSKIGYGGTYESKQTEYIGTVPIGYADGVHRFMQGFSVLVDGQCCEIVGRVSMDQITIRLPQSYALGTQVTLIGSSGQQTIAAQDWADYGDTIHYEVVCLLSDRIPRVYKEH